MKTMKRIAMIFMMVFLTGMVFAQEQEKISISRIRIYLDDEEITSESENENQIKFSTILSFTNFQVDKEMTLPAVEKEMQQTKLRLMNSGLFYNVTVEKMKSRKNPGTYIIYINVTTGFLKRYGGGGIYAVLGNAALHGNRDMLLWYFGWNKNGLSYLNENCFGVPVILGGEFFTDAPQGLFSEKIISGNDGVDFSGKGTFGGFITPDLRLCVDVATDFNCSSVAFTKDFAISPYLSQAKLISEQFSWTSELRFAFFPLDNWNKKYEGAFTFNFTPTPKLTLATLAAGGYSDENLFCGIKLLRGESNLCQNLGLSNREIRSGYSEEDLTVRGYLMTSAEVRWNAVSFMIPPCFPCSIVPYAFADVAFVEKQTGRENQFLDAYGFGCQLNFDCPVFVHFNFSYGFNHFGKGRFSFAVMQSF